VPESGIQCCNRTRAGEDSYLWYTSSLVYTEHSIELRSALEIVVVQVEKGQVITIVQYDFCSVGSQYNP